MKMKKRHRRHDKKMRPHNCNYDKAEMTKIIFGNSDTMEINGLMLQYLNVLNVLLKESNFLAK